MNIRECDIPNINKIGIYCITNLVNGKKYIGKTGNKKGFIHRWNHHKNDFFKNHYPNFVIYRAFNKYSIDNFEFSILEIVERIDNKDELNKILNEKEQYWINYYDTYNSNKGYNMTIGGDGMLGFHHNEKTKFKLSNNRKQYYIKYPEIKKLFSIFQKEQYKNGRKVWCDGLTKETDERVKKISEHLKGKNVSEEQKEKQSKTMKEKFNNGEILPYWKNKHLSEEHKQKISLNHWDSSGKNNPTCVPIVQLTLDGKFVRRYDYIRQVKEFGFVVSNVNECINHKYITKLGDNVYGKQHENKFKWIKESEYNEEISKYSDN